MPPILLDTHIWVWLMDGSAKQIGPTCRRTLEKAAVESSLLVSVMSLWEIAMLDVKARIQLSLDIRAWVDKALTAPGARLQSVTPAIAVDSTRLPSGLHGDPVDRILVATARRVGASLATRDRRILEYARSGHLQVIDAQK
jgi:PIN domain nuclease of toxin-antitoxin system